MPMLQFKCLCGQEFEKIIKAKQAHYKWCKHCDRLTQWRIIDDSHHPAYKETVCQDCLGNGHMLPVLSPNGPVLEESITEPCPVCGQAAEHVLRIEARGHHGGTQTVGDSSVRFHFNYLPASDN
jgi:hypothetical protein